MDETVDITVTLKCNNDCVFCPRRGYLKAVACGSPREIRRGLERTRRQSAKVVLSGGEVTLMPDLPGLIAFCRRLGFGEIGVITNGRALKERGLAEKLIRSGADDFAVSVYSTRSAVHDSVTRRPGSCRETLSGLANLLRLSRIYPVQIRVNMVLNFWNHRDIPASVRELYRRGVRNFIIAEQVIINRKFPSLSLKEVKAALKKIVRLDLGNTRLVLRGFPFCAVPEGGLSGEGGLVIKKQNPFLLMEKHEADTLAGESSRKTRYLKRFSRLFVKNEKCRDCPWSFCCQGIQKAYGTGEK